MTQNLFTTSYRVAAASRGKEHVFSHIQGDAKGEERGANPPP